MMSRGNNYTKQEIKSLRSELPKFPVWLIKELTRQHTPIGWRVMQSSRKSGKVSSGDHTIKVPWMNDVYGVYYFLHECGHVNLGHMNFGDGRSDHITEFEAERYATHTLRACGVVIPEWLIESGKEYVSRVMDKDTKKGVYVRDHIRRWATA